MGAEYFGFLSKKFMFFRKCDVPVMSGISNVSICRENIAGRNHTRGENIIIRGSTISRENITGGEDTAGERNIACGGNPIDGGNSFHRRSSVWKRKTEEKETLTYESPIFTDGGEAFIPKETRIEGEKEYRLVSKRIRNAKKAGEMTYAQVTIPYDLEGDDTVPETADVPLIDEESGTEFERELSLVNVEETSRSWSDTFSFSVTASGYGADSFYLGDMEIPGDADLADYGEKLLELAGLSREYYRVDRVEWDEEPYMDGEVTCRDATAEGSKLIRSVKAKYGGQIRTPDLEGKQYIGIYEEVLPETESGTEEEQETEILSQSEEEPDRSDILKTSLAERIIEWMESHVTTITVSIGILFLLAAGIWLFVKTGKSQGVSHPSFSCQSFSLKPVRTKESPMTNGRFTSIPSVASRAICSSSLIVGSLSLSPIDL